MGSVPVRLKDDCITEALLELRFSVDELDEIVIGKLSDFPMWANYKKSRLPAAHIPRPVRSMDPNLLHQPLIELIAPDQSRKVRIGSSVISYHCTGRYIGWTAFNSELQGMIDHFFRSINGATATRIGLRYVNVLVPKRHAVRTVGDTALQVIVRNDPVSAPLNVNFEERRSPSHLVMTRVATPQFVQGKLDSETALIVDIDVYPPATFSANSMGAVTEWVDQAHTFEKDAFFRLFPDQLVKSWEA